MSARRTIVLLIGIAMILMGLGSVSRATAEDVCVKMLPCQTNTAKYLMRWPAQPMTWCLYRVPVMGDTARAYLTDGEYKRIIDDVLYEIVLDPNIPRDQSIWVPDPAGNYAREVKWVPQADIAGDPRAEGGIPVAVARSYESKAPAPLCWIMATEILFAYDPNLNGTTYCWTGDWCNPPSCMSPLCNMNNVDFKGILKHEILHGFGMADRYGGSCSSYTMYGYTYPQDSCKRTLAGLEADFLTQIYQSNPAAIARGLTVQATSGGAEVAWYEEAKSQLTAGYSLYHLDEAGQSNLVAQEPANPQGVYGVVIPGITSGQFCLMEDETNGMSRPQGCETFSSPVEINPPTLGITNVDSLLLALTWGRPQKAMAASSGDPSLAFAPDSFMTTANLFASVMTSFGKPTVAVNIDTIGGPININPYIQQHQPNGGNTTLLGSSWEGWDVYGRQMWYDTTLYVRYGFTRANYPPQPWKNIIPSYAHFTTVVQPVSLSYGMPWTTSDDGYVDFNSDGLADRGYAIGRIPGWNQATVLAGVSKVLSNLTGNSRGPVYLLNYLHDAGNCHEDVATVGVDSLAMGFPQFTSVYRRDDTSNNPMTGVQRDNVTTQAHSDQSSLVFITGTASGGYEPAGFVRINHGYDVTSLPNNGSLAVGIWLACFTNNHNGTDNPVYGPRACTQMFLAPGGVRAVAGFTSGTAMVANYRIGNRYKKYLLMYPERGLGQNLTNAKLDDVLEFPEDSSVAQEFTLTGSPDQEFPALQPPTVGVEGGNVPMMMMVGPNPCRSAAMVGWTIPRQSSVTLEVFDLQGRRVETLLAGVQAAGFHLTPWPGVNLASGVYVVRLAVAGGGSRMQKVVRLR